MHLCEFNLSRDAHFVHVHDGKKVQRIIIIIITHGNTRREIIFHYTEAKRILSNSERLNGVRFRIELFNAVFKSSHNTYRLSRLKKIINYINSG